MLFILRKLRRSFFLPRKVRTYVAYAVGEVALLVVSIMMMEGTFLSHGLHAGNRIVLKAEAFDEYLKERALEPNKKDQTYLFMKGKYYGGYSNDPSMDRVSFRDLAEDLAFHLQNQQFYPEPDKPKADLLIVVHYGVTSARPDTLEEMMGVEDIFLLSDDPINSSPEQVNRDAGKKGGGSNVDYGLEFNYNASVSIQQANYRASYGKARLLGMEEAYSRKGYRYDEQLLNAMIQEERYFINLLAWDYQKLQQGEQILVWRMRYNVRSTGQSFGTAVAEMNHLAGDYFGTNQKKLVMKRMDDRSQVTIGEIEVIEQVKEEDSQ